MTERTWNLSRVSPRTKILALLLLVAASLAVLFVDAPAFHPVPDRDSGGFMYIGQQMLRGQRLYADLYDDKPPFIFAVNALGMLISGGSAWGVWLLEACSLSAAVILGFEVLASAAGLWPAFLAVLAFLGNLLAFLLGGNFTEEYALPFQFLILFLVLPTGAPSRPAWRVFFAGLAWGIVFYFKQNIFGIGVAVGLLIFLRDLASRRREILWYAAGFLAMIVGVAAFFWASGTLWDFWDATILSNIAYIGAANVHISRTVAIANALKRMLQSGLFFQSALALWAVFAQAWLGLGMIALKDRFRWPGWLGRKRRAWLALLAGGACAGLGIWARFISSPNLPHRQVLWVSAALAGLELGLFGLLHVWPEAGERFKAWVRAAPENARWLFAAAVLALPLDIFSISLSGKGFTHYYLIAYPSAVILLALGASAAGKLFHQTRWKAAGTLAVSAAMLLVALLPLRSLPGAYTVARLPQRESVVEYIQSHTHPGDPVLVWGGEPDLLLLSGTVTPVRFVFMGQPFLSGYATSRFAPEILEEMKAKPPKLIVDTRECKIPFVDYKSYACVPVSGDWQPVFDYIEQNYWLAVRFGSLNWGVYQLVQ